MADLNTQEEVELSIKAAEKMVGSATMSMDPEQLKDAEEAVSIAKKQLSESKAHKNVISAEFFEMSEELLTKIDHQLQEARQ